MKASKRTSSLVRVQSTALGDMVLDNQAAQDLGLAFKFCAQEMAAPAGPRLPPQSLSMSQTVPTPSTAAGKNLHWLLRYARHGGINLNACRDEATTLKNCFTPAAWRLLCRSVKASFLPILRNRHLCFDSLGLYAQSLVTHGFQVAPNAELLDYFIQSSYLFFDRMPSVPHKPIDMTLLRLATRCGGVSRAQLRLVSEWQAWGPGSVTPHMTWRAVLHRANQWHQRQQVAIEHDRHRATSAKATEGWKFACGPVAWHDCEIVPLVNGIDLWGEAQAMSNCLYKLRGLCQATGTPSRFFSVRRNGRRYATLELVCSLPELDGLEQQKLGECWRLQDCRLSHNRLPPEELIEQLSAFAMHYSAQASASPFGHAHTPLALVSSQGPCEQNRQKAS